MRSGQVSRNAAAEARQAARSGTCCRDSKQTEQTLPDAAIGHGACESAAIANPPDRDGAVDRHGVTEQVQYRAVIVYRRGKLLPAPGGLRPGDADLDPDS
jgi:hypothetical protein